MGLSIPETGLPSILGSLAQVRLYTQHLNTWKNALGLNHMSYIKQTGAVANMIMACDWYTLDATK